jgi:hypothetical protein
MEERPNDLTLKVAKLAALSCSLAVAPYAALQVEPSPVAAFLLSGVPLLAVLLWLQKDAQRTGVGAILDWGYFLLVAWPVVIPWYAFQTRGRNGWQLTVRLFGLIGAPYISWLLVAYVARYFEAGA